MQLAKEGRIILDLDEVIEKSYISSHNKGIMHYLVWECGARRYIGPWVVEP